MITIETNERIKELALQGKGCRLIAKELGISVKAAYNWMKKLNVVINNPDIKSIELEEIKKRVEQKYTKFEYIGGYTSSQPGARIILRCRECGETFDYTSQILRPSRNMNIKCPGTECVRKEAEERKVVNKVKKETNRVEKEKEQKKLREQKLEQKKLREQKEMELKRIQNMKILKCVECGEEYYTLYLKSKYCSDKCRKKNTNRIKEINRRIKLKENGKIDYSISLNKLIKRDKGICKLCGEKIDINAYKMRGETFIAKGMYPSIDHIIPVAKGGTHSWDNVQLAHCMCNAIKNDNSNVKIVDNQILLSI